MSITVKLDRNYNSVADSYDWPLSGVVIKLIRDTHKGGLVIASSVSTGSGTAGFSVTTLPGATYHLSVRIVARISNDGVYLESIGSGILFRFTYHPTALPIVLWPAGAAPSLNMGMNCCSACLGRFGTARLPAPVSGCTLPLPHGIIRQHLHADSLPLEQPPPRFLGHDPCLIHRPCAQVTNPPLEGTQLALRLPHVRNTPAHSFTLRTGRHNQYARTASFTAPPASTKNFTMLVQDTQVR